MNAMRPFSLLSFLCFVFCVTSAQADCKPKTSETVVVTLLAPDGHMELADGRHVRLAALEPPLAAGAMKAWTAVVAADTSKTFTLYHGKKPTDRYGQLQGLVIRADGTWIDAELVRKGWARVSPRADMRFCLPELLKLEDEAREGRRGLWAEPANRPLQATDIAALAAREGRFTLVEGVVTDATSRGGRLYLNFGTDWKTDFTVTVAPADVRLFRDPRIKAKSGERPAMKGERVRVRGLLVLYNGPELILTVPEQLEFLGPADKTDNKAATRTGSGAN